MKEIVKIIETAADLLSLRKDITSPEIYTLELAKEVAKRAALAERKACAKIAREFVWYEAENCSPDESNERIAQLIEARSNVELCGGTSATNAVLGTAQP